MKMSEEMAVRLHRMMWSDMQKDLGDTNVCYRAKYKETWLDKHFPGEHFMHHCFLCEYVTQQTGNRPLLGSNDCKLCPIKWPGDNCSLREREGGVFYLQSPISEILALPARNGEKRVNDRDLMALAYCNTKTELAKASGLPEEKTTTDHIAEIKKKEDRSVMQVLENFSGLKGEGCWVIDHVKAIKEKAVEEYFESKPGAKLATMDVDQAFKQYADEQKAPIFRALAEASGLSAGNESVKAHLSSINTKAKNSGRNEKAKEIFKALSTYSGVKEGNWSVYDHATAIMRKAPNENELDKVRKALSDTIRTLKLYQSALSYESNLPSNAPVAEHIAQIRKYAFHDGQIHERERIMDKIGEMLNDKPTGTSEDS